MNKGEKEEKLAVTAAVAITRRRQDSRERSVLVKAEKQSENNGKPAAAENVGAEDAVLRAEYEQSDKNPKGGITLVATSHIKPPVLAAGVCKIKITCGLFFLLHHILIKRQSVSKKVLFQENSA